jgi:hypothetical protein
MVVGPPRATPAAVERAVTEHQMVYALIVLFGHCGLAGIELGQERQRSGEGAGELCRRFVRASSGRVRWLTVPARAVRDPVPSRGAGVGPMVGRVAMAVDAGPGAVREILVVLALAVAGLLLALLAAFAPWYGG